MEDTSLDEFANTETTDGSEREDKPDTESSEPQAEDGTAALSDVEPATGTSRWVGNDGRCSECSEPAPRLWNDDGQFVCQACKEW